MTDWMKMKIVRDFRKHKKSNYFSYNSNFSKKYVALLDLIRTTFYTKNIDYILEENKITISFLNSINLDLFDEIINLQNVKIVCIPKFIISTIKNNQIYQTSVIVLDINNIMPLKIIKCNPGHMFYIYYIDNNYARWYEIEDKSLFRNCRMEKIKNLNKISTII